MEDDFIDIRDALVLAIEESPNAFFWISPEGKILYSNAKAQRILNHFKNNHILQEIRETSKPFLEKKIEIEGKEFLVQATSLRDMGYGLFIEERGKAHTTQDILKFFENVSRYYNANTVLNEIANFAMRNLPVEKVSIFLKDKSRLNVKRVIYKSKPPLDQTKPPYETFKIGDEGIVGRVAGSGVPYYAKNVDEDPFYIKVVEGERSELVYPIGDEDEIYGVFEFGSSSIDAFKETDIEIIERVVRLSSLILRNIFLYNEAQKEFERLSLLFSFQQNFQKYTNLNEIFLKCFEELKHRFKFYGIGLWKEDKLLHSGLDSLKDALKSLLKRGIPFDSPGTIKLDGTTVWLAPFSRIRNHCFIVFPQESQEFLSDDQEYIQQVVYLFESWLTFPSSQIPVIPPNILKLIENIYKTEDIKAFFHKICQFMMEIFSASGGALYSKEPHGLVCRCAYPEDIEIPEEFFQQTWEKIGDWDGFKVIPLTDIPFIVVIKDPKSAPENLELLQKFLSLQIKMYHLREEERKQRLLVEAAKRLMIAQTKVESVDEFLQEASRILQEALGYLYTQIVLKEDPEHLKVVASAGYEDWEKWADLRIKIGVEGLSGIAAGKREVIYAPDVSKNPYYIKTSDEVQSEIAIPIMTEEETYGALVVSSNRKFAFYDEDISLLKAFADHMALFLKHEFQLQMDRSILSSLSEESQFSETIIRNLPIGIIVIDAGFAIKRLNATVEFMLKRPINELIGQHICNILCEHGGEATEECPIRESFIARRPLRNEKLFLEIQGDKAPFSLNSAFMYNDKNEIEGTILMLEDIQTVASLEEQLRRSERLSAIGRIASHMAHEIKNPLASISTGIEYLQSSFKKDEPAREYINVILREIYRLDRLIKNLLNFARRRPLNKVSADIGDLINETLLIHGQEFEEKKIDIKKNFPEEKINVFVDIDQMKEVFINFIRNAIESMEQGGTLTIEMNSLPREVEISFKDTGSGIPEENLPQIFEPFFSTKKGGSGLGLSIVHRIIEDHGGRVTVESDKGTTFRVTIPL